MRSILRAKELRDLGEKELKQKALELKQELFNLKFQLRAGQLLNTSAIRNTKRNLAKVLTVMREKGFKLQ